MVDVSATRPQERNQLPAPIEGLTWAMTDHGGRRRLHCRIRCRIDAVRGVHRTLGSVMHAAHKSTWYAKAQQ